MWAAPEYYEAKTLPDFAAADMFSLGLMIWRVLLDIKSPFDVLHMPEIPEPNSVDRPKFIQACKASPLLLKYIYETLEPKIEKSSPTATALGHLLVKDPKMRSLASSLECLRG